MACLGELDIVRKTIAATASVGDVEATFAGIVAEAIADGTARAVLAQTGDTLQGLVSSAITTFSMNGDRVVVTSLTVSDVEATIDYCTCNGLCY